MYRPLALSMLALSAALMTSGCRHKCCRTDGRSLPPPYLPSGPGTTIPPASVPTIPPGSSGSLPPPDLSPPRTSNRPAPEILLPDPIGPGGASSRSKSPDGVLGAPAKAAAPSSTSPEPRVAVKPPATPTRALLPGFTSIKEGLATGHKPTLDGFDSLKKEGYKTVFFLHAPGADVGAVRDLADTRGLVLVPIETTPEKLGEAFEELKKTTGEKASLPAYVFDDDGSRAGAVWYLYFKTVEIESADVSKIRARALGLADRSEFWPAIKKYLDK